MKCTMASERVRELIREVAGRALELPPAWLEELDAVTLSEGGVAEVAEDPVLSASVKRANRANLRYWLEASLREPGAPVPANLGPEPLGIARDLVRRGLDDTALNAYRVGQNVAWRFWMQLCFEVTRDPEELRELLDVTARSISGFIDAQIAGIAEQMQQEREALTRGTHAERREVVALIIDGAPITRERAATRLGYDLDRTHTAAVVWSDDPAVEHTALEEVAQMIGPLTVVAAASTLWVWSPNAVDAAAVEAALFGGVRVALGPRASGLEGFRRSHLDALTAQRLLARLESPLRLATYEAVALVALVTQDETRAAAFVRETLGGLETAGAELRDTVSAYIDAGSQRLPDGGAAVHAPQLRPAPAGPGGRAAAPAAGRAPRAGGRGARGRPVARGVSHAGGMSFQQKVCVVTGAGSGIGRALALDLARRGARLALSDVNEAGLAETARLAGGEVHTQRLDVSDRDAVIAYADTVAAHFGVVHQLYNNAGIAYSSSVLESDYEDWDRVLGINLFGVITGSKAFLPHLIASGDGHVVNISSLNGILAQAESSHYCTAKFGVRGFTESLRLEMLAAGHPVKVTVVHPGGIKTNIATAALESAREAGKEITAAQERRHRVYQEKLLKMDPAQAAAVILKGVEAGRMRVLVGNDAKALDLLVRVLPTLHSQLLRAGEKRLFGS